MSVVEQLLAEGHVAELVFTPPSETPVGDELVPLTRCRANQRIPAASDAPSENLLKCVQVAIANRFPVLLAFGRGFEAQLYKATRALKEAHYLDKVALVGPEAQIGTLKI